MTVRELISSQLIAEDAKVCIKRLPCEESDPYEVEADINYIETRVWGKYRVACFTYYPEIKRLTVKVVEPEKINEWGELLWPILKKHRTQ